MFESQFSRVQELAWRLIASLFGDPVGLPFAVHVIAEDGKTQVLKMHPDLVGPSGVESGFDEGGFVQQLLQLITCPRDATFGGVGNGHSLSMRRMPGDVGLDVTGSRRDMAADNALVDLFNSTVGELFAQRNVCAIVFGDDQASAGA